MILYDFKYYDGLTDGLKFAGVEYGTPAYELAMEVYALRNIRACRIPVRKWDRKRIVRKFRRALKRAGSAADLLHAMLLPRAKKAKTGSEHWIHGADECTPYCGRCIDAAVRHEKRHGNLDVCRDGGWGQENDGPSWCAGCGVYLDETILQWREELERSVTSGPTKSPVECAILLNCIDGARYSKAGRKLIRRIALQYFAAFPSLRPLHPEQAAAGRTVR